MPQSVNQGTGHDRRTSDGRGETLRNSAERLGRAGERGAPKRLAAALRLRRGRPADPAQDLDTATVVEACLEAGADEILLLEENTSAGQINPLIRATVDACRAAGSAPVAVLAPVVTLDEVTRLRRAGAERVVLGTSAVGNPELVRQAAERFGSAAVSVLIDVRLERRRGEATVDVGADGTVLLDTDMAGGWYRVYVRGGDTATARDALAWAQECVELGAGELILRAIDPAGETADYDLELIGRISEGVDVPVLAAGPAAPTDNVREVLTLTGAAGVALLDAATIPGGDLRALHDELRQGGVRLAQSG